MKHSLHVVEPSGYGGIFHYTQAFASDKIHDYADVTIHTSVQHEEISGYNELNAIKDGKLTLCECFNWFRHLECRNQRRLYFLTYFLFRTLPHFNSISSEFLLQHPRNPLTSFHLIDCSMPEDLNEEDYLYSS